MLPLNLFAGDIFTAGGHHHSGTLFAVNFLQMAAIGW